MEQVKPCISVITVCYNAESNIEKTILSVLNQRYDNIEYIIVDGGSTDSTMQIINKFKDKIAFIVSEPDNGIYDAMNKGIAHANGEWITFRNAGDLFVSDTSLLDVFSRAIDEDVDVIHGDCIYINDWGWKLTHPRIANEPEVWKKAMPILHPASFIRANTHKQYPFNEHFKISGDFDLFHRLLSDGKKVKYIQIPIAFFEVGGYAMSHLKRTFKEDLYIIHGNKDDKMTMAETLSYMSLCIKLKIMFLANKFEIIKKMRMLFLLHKGWRPLPYEK